MGKKQISNFDSLDCVNLCICLFVYPDLIWTIASTSTKMSMGNVLVPIVHPWVRSASAAVTSANSNVVVILNDSIIIVLCYCLQESKAKRAYRQHLFFLASLVSRNKILCRGVQTRTKKGDFYWRTEFLGWVYDTQVLPGDSPRTVY
jgi:hypothetical protein